MHATSSFLPIPDRGPDFQIADCREPTIAELLADPLTRALMKADDVDIPAFRQMLASVAGRFREGAGAATQPIVALKADLGVKTDPSIPDYFRWTPAARRFDSAAAQSVHGAIAATISGVACGSPCSW
jgi:hypothetical protein